MFSLRSKWRVEKGKTMSSFDYNTAFGRNLGVVTPEEQRQLRQSRVALAGMGGVGGIYALALARLGVGQFSLADGDTFETANFNRQMGGFMSTVGRNKARSLEKQIHDINPDAVVDVWEEHLGQHNIAAFLSGTNLVLDGIEAFSVSAHRLLFHNARELGLPVFIGFPLGFSTAALVFDPRVMSADEYFDWHDGQDKIEQVLNFALGSAPAVLHLGQFDLRYVDFDRQVGPSHIGACLLCAGVMACEATRLLLHRPGVRFAPNYTQFEPYTGRLKRGRLRWGLRGPWMRLKKRILLRRLKQLRPGGLSAEKPACVLSA
jgi:hypothetical protein